MTSVIVQDLINFSKWFFFFVIVWTRKSEKKKKFKILLACYCLYLFRIKFLFRKIIIQEICHDFYVPLWIIKYMIICCKFVYLNGIDAHKGCIFGVVLSVWMPMIVHVSMEMPVMIQARRRPISRPGIGMTRVQLVHRLQVMVMIVNVVQPAMSSGIGVRWRGFARYTGADVMMIYTGMTSQAARRASPMAAQRCRRQTAVDVDHVPVHCRWAAVVHHTRIWRRTAQSTRNTVMIVGKGGIWMMSQARAGAKSMMSARRVYVVYRGRDGHRRWMMMSSGSGRAGLIYRTGTCNDNAIFYLF